MSHITFCVTGKTFSSPFFQAWTRLISNLSKTDVRFDVLNVPNENPYLEKNVCIDRIRETSSDIVVWIDSSCVFDLSHFNTLFNDIVDGGKDVVAGMRRRLDGSYLVTKPESKYNDYITGEEVEDFIRLHPQSLMAVDFTELAFCVMNANIFKKVDSPWCLPQSVGDSPFDVLSPDFSFCSKIRLAGYIVCVNPSVRVSSFIGM